jgi:hypothetical protein
MKKFIARVIERTEAIKMGNHWIDNNDETNFISAARKILSYIKLGKEEKLNY